MVASPLILAIDAGSISTRCTLFAADGTLVASIAWRSGARACSGPAVG